MLAHRRNPIRRKSIVIGALAVTTALTVWVGALYVVPAVELGRSWNEIERVSLDATYSPIESTTSSGPTQSTVGAGDVEANALTTGPHLPEASSSTASDGTASTRAASPSAQTVGPGATASPSVTKRRGEGKKNRSESSTPSATATSTTVALTSTVPPSEVPRTILLVGSDSRTDVDGEQNFGSFEGQRADVIVLAVFDGSGISLISVPRDLAVPDLCNGGTHKIGEAFAGCGDNPGLSQLVAEVGSVMGVEIGHAAAIEMAGFREAVDAVGGYEICSVHPLRDDESGLDIDAGCRMADGHTTLAWIRSRHTERHVDGRWEPLPAVSDLARNEREREFLIDMLDRVGDDLSVDQLLSVGQSIAPYLTIDDELSLQDVVRLAWQFRGSDVETIEIPVAYDRLADGSSVLVPTQDPADIVPTIR